MSPSELSEDNNLPARLAAQAAGFTHQHHSMECVPHDSAQQCTKPPLLLEERGS